MTRHRRSNLTGGSILDGSNAPGIRELVLALHDQMVALTHAIRAMEQRLPTPVVSVAAAARHLAVSVQTIRRWCKTGRLAYVRRGRELRIDLTKVRALTDEDVRRLAGRSLAERGRPPR